ncbi:hypothetical protein [Rhodococcoides corynebacterioides]|uniref:hypothetical protein n=1 Tax=Rhodococcoides corynebacterioides TaxID=53972 RepID=UPI00082A5EBA|nr:hypothetical protein [Rhodococcus corynebacterioides]
MVATFVDLHVWSGDASDLPDEPGYRIIVSSSDLADLMREHGDKPDSVAEALSPPSPVTYEV